MKHYLTIFVSLFALQLAALPVGNPADPSAFCTHLLSNPAEDSGKLSCRLSYLGNYVQNRKMQLQMLPKPTAYEAALMTQSGVFTVNVLQRLDLMASMGASNLRVQSPVLDRYEEVIEDETGQLSTLSNFSWGVGVRGMLLQAGPITVGGGAQYFYTHPVVSRVREEYFEGSIADQGIRVLYEELQLDVASSYTIALSRRLALLPYIGLQYSQAVLNGEDAEFLFFHFPALIEQRTVGYSLGLTLMGGQCCHLTIEQRLLNENALSVVAGFRY